MMRKSTRLVVSANLAAGANIGLRAPWGGGRGWIVVNGTFTGASALIGVSIITNGGDLDSISVPLPDIPSGITTSGIYPFEAPQGMLSISSAIVGGDSLSITELSLVDVNR